LVNAWLLNAILNVNLQTNNNFQQGFVSHFNNGCFCKFIFDSVSEGAQTPLSMLIVGCRYSKIFPHFCSNCRIFCEGVKGNGNDIVNPQSANYHNMAIKLVKFIGRVGHTNGLVGHNIQIQAQLIVVTASQLIVASASQFIVATASVNTNTKLPFDAFDWQKIFKGTHLNGLNGTFSLAGLFADFSGFCLISLIRLCCIIGLVGQTSLVGSISLISQISLIDSSALSNHWPIGLIGIIGFGLIALSTSAALLAHWPCNFAAATCQVGPVDCTGPNSFNSVSGLIR
jgi:hypothetical protein